MKTTLKIFTISFMMIVGVFTVSAQSTILFIEIQPFLASIQGFDSDIIISSAFTTGEIYFFEEENQLLEEWMVDQDNWSMEPSSKFMHGINDSSVETDLVIEDWMMEEFSAEIQNSWEFLSVDIEPPLKVEEWMICKEPWCNTNIGEN